MRYFVSNNPSIVRLMLSYLESWAAKRKNDATARARVAYMREVARRAIAEAGWEKRKERWAKGSFKLPQPLAAALRRIHATHLDLRLSLRGLSRFVRAAAPAGLAFLAGACLVALLPRYCDVDNHGQDEVGKLFSRAESGNWPARRRLELSTILDSFIGSARAGQLTIAAGSSNYVLSIKVSGTTQCTERRENIRHAPLRVSFKAADSIAVGSACERSLRNCEVVGASEQACDN